MHASSTRDAATLRPAGSPAGRPNLSRATRRDVRRAAALANELNFFSFTVHPDGAITWILRHQGISMAKPKPEGKGEPAASEEPSARLYALCSLLCINSRTKVTWSWSQYTIEELRPRAAGADGPDGSKRLHRETIKTIARTTSVMRFAPSTATLGRPGLQRVSTIFEFGPF